MKISDKKVVSLIYELIVDGELADHCTEERPLEFIQGTGMLLPKFEEYLEGLEPDDPFAFTLSPAEGYGEWNPQLVIELPTAAFEIDGKLRTDLMVVGNILPLTNGHGGIVPGKIVEVGELFVKIDVNSQMAGKPLNFSGKILNVREPSEKELKEGLHGELVNRGCGGCKGGDCGDCEGCGKDGDCNCNNCDCEDCKCEDCDCEDCKCEDCDCEDCKCKDCDCKDKQE